MIGFCILLLVLTIVWLCIALAYHQICFKDENEELNKDE